MGYTTTFSGWIDINPALNAAEISFLKDLAHTRRMDRSNGPLFVRGEGDFGQGDGPDEVRAYNGPHESQPGLWLQWVPSDDGTMIEWDRGEKFYYAAEWMKYLIANLLSPTAIAYIDIHGPASGDERLEKFTCNHVLNGEISAEGEEPDDRWKLIVRDNDVFVAQGTFSYGREMPV